MSRSSNKTYRFSHLYRGDDWLSPGYVDVDANGMIVGVTGVPTGELERRSERFDGFAVPGMPNVHSHAYLRALAGFAEPIGTRNRDFWAWRDRMYELALGLEPPDIEAITAQVFVEMTKAGFTSVGEFHYLHRAPDGRPYADPAEVSRRVIAAADAAGIGLTLLPALYMHGGVDAPLGERQRRFASGSVDEYLALLGSLGMKREPHELLRVGAAPHSVRAVTERELRDLIDGLDRAAPAAPIHMHLAEQRGEVEESLDRRGERPGEWLAHRFAFSSRWTLVHATHCDQNELAEIARREATVGLCPVTEANLGDGLFALPAYEAERGRWGVGTDSNTAIGVALELGVLEYGQRSARQRRDVHSDDGRSAGSLLFASALRGGAASLGQPVGSVEPGKRADLLVFDPNAPAFVGHDIDTFLDAWLVSGGAAAPSQVMVGGRWVVRDRRHLREDEVARRFAVVMSRLHRRDA
ncbi:MAG: formimidoylglutamate deiminase [Chloroflexi bacterium]|nr:MAG: formimidoylglutamate deiminase [Chloroflexota bacterium]